MKLITVSGAYSNIGKTTLARRIKKVLGDRAVVIKIGHGEPKDKPEIFTDNINDALQMIHDIKIANTYDYIIIESNRIMAHREPDLSFFIDGDRKPAKESAKLAKNLSKIIISHNMDVESVRPQLIRSGVFTNEQLPLMEEYIRKTFNDSVIDGLSVKTKIWLEKDGDLVFGYGKYLLLKKIEELESLNKAAKELKMSYRHAWAYIKAIEERLGYTILEPKIPGKKNSGSKLSEMAERLMHKYEHLMNSINQQI